MGYRPVVTEYRVLQSADGARWPCLALVPVCEFVPETVRPHLPKEPSRVILESSLGGVPNDELLGGPALRTRRKVPVVAVLCCDDLHGILLLVCHVSDNPARVRGRKLTRGAPCNLSRTGL